MDRDALLKKLIALNPMANADAQEHQSPSEEDQGRLNELVAGFSELAKRSNALEGKAVVVERIRNFDYSRREDILERMSQTFSRIADADLPAGKPASLRRREGAPAQRGRTGRTDASLRELQQQIDDLQRRVEEIVSANKPRVVAEVRTLISEYHVSAAELGLTLERSKGRAKQSSPSKKRSPGWPSGERSARSAQDTRSDTNKHRQVAD
jgi:hypothetical protein